MVAIYLDNNATTRPDPQVVAEMLPFLTEHFGNASSTHLFGEDVAEAVRQARRRVQALLGAAHDHEVIFTSGGTESNSTAIFSALEAQETRNEIVTTAVEHPAILTLLAHLEKTRGVKVHCIPVDRQGRLDIDAFENVLGPSTALVSIMWANNETGALFPVVRLAEMAHAAGALFHSDAVQAVGKLPIALTTTMIDMLSLSGHKLHGPKGIGALYVRKGTPFKPLIRGGHQERGRRGGTENVPAIVGLGKAAELSVSHLDEEATRVRALRDRLEQGILAAVDHCFVNGGGGERLPNTTNIAFDYMDGEPILLHMSRAGLAASSGSACTSGSMEPSHVLKAMNVPVTALRGAVRLSLSRETTDAEVDHVLDVLPAIIETVRAMSPTWINREAAARLATADYL